MANKDNWAEKLFDSFISLIPYAVVFGGVYLIIRLLMWLLGIEPYHWSSESAVWIVLVIVAYCVGVRDGKKHK